jgi:hypothetical protein
MHISVVTMQFAGQIEFALRHQSRSLLLRRGE